MQFSPEDFHGEPMQAAAKLVNKLDADKAKDTLDADTRAQIEELRFQLMTVLRRKKARS